MNRRAIDDIDFHAHIYPENYLKKLEASNGDVRIVTNEKGEKIILSMGAKAGPVTPDFFDVDLRVEPIKENRVDMQILSSPHPGVDRFSPARKRRHEPNHQRWYRRGG